MHAGNCQAAGHEPGQSPLFGRQWLLLLLLLLSWPGLADEHQSLQLHSERWMPCRKQHFDQ
jgi:hypothetical protein